MNVLLIDDEVGIREGLGAFLRLKGHRVRSAGSAAEALQEFHTDTFDLVVTDWRLPDGSGETVVAACACPVIAFSGSPEEVASTPGVRVVLQKPVSPHRLLAEVEALQTAPDRGPDRALPTDTADRVALALALIAEPDSVEVLDDGAFITVNIAVPVLPDRAIAQLELIGGDLRVWGSSPALHVELRLCRDGRPAGTWTHRGWSEWADTDREAVVDVTADRLPSPAEFLELLDRVVRARRNGDTVHLINVPSHLRLYAEISGRDHDMPKRGKAEPRLPEVLTRLWS